MYEIKRFGAHRKVRGVISGIPLGEKLEELKKNIKGGNIVACRWSCHEYDKCGSEVIKGSNCGGGHTAAYGGCPARCIRSYVSFGILKLCCMCVIKCFICVVLKMVG